MNDTMRLDLDPRYSNAPLTAAPTTDVPNGGFLAGLLLKAIEKTIADRDLHPRSVAVNYRRASDFSLPMEVAVDILSRGKRSIFARAEGRQSGGVNLAAEATYGAEQSGAEYRSTFVPAVALPADCPEATLPRELTPHFTGRCEYRLAKAPRPFSGARNPEMLCWIRPRDVGIDAATMLFIIDSMFPAFYLAATAPLITRTTNLNVMFSGSPERSDPEAWILARFRVTDWMGAWCLEEAELWTQQGQLLATCQHMRRVFVVENGAPS